MYIPGCTSQYPPERTLSTTRVYLLLYPPGCTSCYTHQGVPLTVCTSQGVPLTVCTSQGVAPAELYLRVLLLLGYTSGCLSPWCTSGCLSPWCTSGCGLCWFYTSGCGFMLVLSLFYTSQGGYFSRFTPPRVGISHRFRQECGPLLGEIGGFEARYSLGCLRFILINHHFLHVSARKGRLQALGRRC